MMVDLTEFGLTDYENTVYNALVQTGISKAHQLSQKSGVPYGKIYTVLASLEQKGFVKNVGEPKQFVAADPKVVLREIAQKKEKELEKFKTHAEKAIEHLVELAARKPKEPFEQIRIIEGYDNYLNLSIALHKEAKQEWCSITELTIHNEHYDATADCIKRGVHVRLLTYMDEKDKKNLELWKKIGAEVRFIEYTPTQFSIIDGKEVTMRITGEERYIALWLKNKPLAQNMRNYFNILWKKAQR